MSRRRHYRHHQRNLCGIEPLESRLLMAAWAVLNKNDSGPGSLRQAIATAADGDLLDLSHLSGTLTLTSGAISIDKSLTLVGPNSNILFGPLGSPLAISGNNASRIFNVAAGATLDLNDLALANGNSGAATFGGAVYSQGSLNFYRVTVRDSRAMTGGGAVFQTGGGTLALEECVFSNNVAIAEHTGVPAWGGALAVFQGTLTVQRSSFYDNVADGEVSTAAQPNVGHAYGGAVGLIDVPSAYFVNSTFSKNRAQGSRSDDAAIAPNGSGYGGGMWVDGTATTLHMLHCTFADNQARPGAGAVEAPGEAKGGGLYATGAVLYLANNLLANNMVWLATPNDFASTTPAMAANGNVLRWVDPADAQSFVSGNNRYNVGAINLAALTTPAVGKTPYRVPAHDSAAIDAGISRQELILRGWPAGVVAAAADLDQRFVARASSGLADLPDAGAVENPDVPVAGYGRALKLNGLNQSVSIPKNAALEHPAFTVQAWIKTEGSALPQTIYSYGKTGTTAVISLSYQAGRFVFQVGGVNAQFAFPSAQLVGQWVAVAASYDGSRARLFVNGEQIGPAATLNAAVVYPVAGGGAIGSMFGASNFFKGQIDEVLLSNSAALGGSSLQGPYQPRGRDATLVAAWHFDETAGTTAAERISAVHGTLVNSSADSNVASTVPLQILVNEDFDGTHALQGYGGRFEYGGYRIISAPTRGAATFVDPDAGIVTYTPDADATGNDSFTYMISNAGGDSEIVTVTVTITPTNDAPVINTTPMTVARAKSQYIYPITFGDVDGDAVTITAPTLPGWLTLTDNGNRTATLTGLPDDADVGDHTVTLRVFDGLRETLQTFTIHVGPNDAPFFGAIATPPASAGSFYGQKFAVGDPEDDALTVIADHLPAWLRLGYLSDENVYTLYGTPTNADVGVHEVRLVAHDGVNVTEQIVSIEVTYTNQAPQFLGTPPTTVNSGVAYDYDLGGFDPDNDALTMTATTLPSWLALVQGDGFWSLQGAPTNADAGANPVVLVLSDGEANVEYSFTIAVSSVNHAPVFTSTAPNIGDGSWAATSESLWTYHITAYDADGDPLAITANALPSWMTLVDHGDGTATLAGTGFEIGEFPVSIEVSDGFATTLQNFTIVVEQSNRPPTFTNPAPTGATSGMVFDFPITAEDADPGLLHLSVVTLPSWLVLVDNHDGTGRLFGIPTDAHVGAANTVTLRVSDSFASTEMTFNIAVGPNHVPTFTSTPPATPVIAGTPYVYTMSTADADGESRTIMGNTLPAWLTLTDHGNGTATLAGTPADADGGINPVTLHLSDGHHTVEQSFNVEVLVERFRLVNGVLSVTGGVENDTIQVWIKDNSVRAIRNGVIKNYPLSAIKEVQLLGFDGNDSLSVNTRHLPAYAVGGAGNDTILGGDEPDNFVGGGGKDVLDSGGGNDRLDGGNGNDKLLGGMGDDRLIGNDGNDVLIGGDGVDQFFGGLGDDYLYSRDAFIDVLNGGDGNDSAQLDTRDLREDLLALLP